MKLNVATAFGPPRIRADAQHRSCDDTNDTVSQLTIHSCLPIADTFFVSRIVM